VRLTDPTAVLPIYTGPFMNKGCRTTARSPPCWPVTCLTRRPSFGDIFLICL
jgi:hypothetical protein